MRAFFRWFSFSLVIAISWMLGARFGAPQPVLDLFDRVSQSGLERSTTIGEDVLQGIGEEAPRLVEDLKHFTDDLVARFDDDPQYEETVQRPIAQASAQIPPQPAIEPRPPSTAVAVGASPGPAIAASAKTMVVCATQVSNAPKHNGEGHIQNFRPVINVNNTPLLLAPVTRSCLSSGYGPRGSSGRLHKGVDYYTKDNGDVLAAGNGVIVEAIYRDDYGYMIVIDHGSGVFTRYAHLKRFANGIVAGASVQKGQMLGPIGNSGAYTSVAHLHFEILQGDYGTPKKSFGLSASDPYSFLSNP